MNGDVEKALAAARKAQEDDARRLQDLRDKVPQKIQRNG